jgi:hypothetical protein
MKATSLIGFVCGVASIAQCAQFTDLDLRVDGVCIAPTVGIALDQLDHEHEPWWGNSDLAFHLAADYGEALFNWAKYNDPSLVEHLPSVYFGFEANGGWVDTWVFDHFTGRMYEDDGIWHDSYLFAESLQPGAVPDAGATGVLVVLGVCVMLGLSKANKTFSKS